MNYHVMIFTIIITFSGPGCYIATGRVTVRPRGEFGDTTRNTKLYYESLAPIMHIVVVCFCSNNKMDSLNILSKEKCD